MAPLLGSAAGGMRTTLHSGCPANYNGGHMVARLVSIQRTDVAPLREVVVSSSGRGGFSTDVSSRQRSSSLYTSAPSILHYPRRHRRGALAAAAAAPAEAPYLPQGMSLPSSLPPAAARGADKGEAATASTSSSSSISAPVSASSVKPSELAGQQQQQQQQTEKGAWEVMPVAPHGAHKQATPAAALAATVAAAAGPSPSKGFSYAPAERSQIRESWDSLMRWSKVGRTGAVQLTQIQL